MNYWRRPKHALHCSRLAADIDFRFCENERLDRSGHTDPWFWICKCNGLIRSLTSLQEQCGSVNVFGTFFSFSLSLSPRFIRVRSVSPIWFAKVHRKKMFLNCRIKMAVEGAGVVCLVCVCWLANRGQSLKSRRHITFPLGHFKLQRKRRTELLYQELWKKKKKKARDNIYKSDNMARLYPAVGAFIKTFPFPSQKSVLLGSSK